MSRCREEPLVFECGGDRLVGILHSAVATRPKLGVLVVVGGPQYRVGSHRQFVLMARDLAAAGYPVLRFDYRGMGDSDGKPRTFLEVADDIEAAIAGFRQAIPDLERVVLWGLCDAASAILMLNPAPPEVVGRVLVNPWARTEAGEARAYVRHYYLQRILRREFWRKLASGALDMRKVIGQFLSVLRRAHASPASGEETYIGRMLRGAVAFRGLTLILLSGRDLTAREFEALEGGSETWRQFLGLPRVQRLRLDEADHTFSERAAHEAGTRATIDFAARLEDARA